MAAINTVYTETKKTTVKDIYGVDLHELKIPDGYELTGEFLPPKRGERFLSANGNVSQAMECLDRRYPYLILRKKPEVTVKSVYGTDNPVIPHGWEKTGEFRAPLIGEYFLCQKGWYDAPVEQLDPSKFWYNVFMLQPKRLILRRVNTEDDEIQRVYGKKRSEIKAPAGWKLGELRTVKPGEYLLGSNTWTASKYTVETESFGKALILLPDNVYNKPLPEVEIPEGFESTGEYRHVRGGEWCLAASAHLTGAAGYAEHDLDYLKPRLILRKKAPKLKTVKFIPTGEHRQPRKGEWYEFAGRFILAECLIYLDEHDIYRREEE